MLNKGASLQIGCISARAVCHPLLLEPCLPPLKDPPATEAVNYDASYTANPSNSAAADSMGRASWEPQQPPRQTYGRRGMPKGKAPCPVDLLVPAGVKVVAVTGPNTGSCPGLSHKHSDTHTHLLPTCRLVINQQWCQSASSQLQAVLHVLILCCVCCRTCHYCTCSGCKRLVCSLQCARFADSCF